jgi:hypothetical protein
LEKINIYCCQLAEVNGLRKLRLRQERITKGITKDGKKKLHTDYEDNFRVNHYLSTLRASKSGDNANGRLPVFL